MYKDWGKKFYPPDLKDPDKLSYISHHYKTLEINTSFYHFVKKALSKNGTLNPPEILYFRSKLPGFTLMSSG